MDWIEYEQAFREKAKTLSLVSETTENLLQYARPIFSKGFPIIYDLNHLSLLVGYDIDYILRACKNSTSFYRIFAIPKKNGKQRIIAEPLPSLKEIQNWILTNILHKSKPSRFCKAYIKGASIRSNAKFHRNKAVVLGIDIENYFPNIKIDRVQSFFSEIGYNDEVATILSELCCLENCLPQGAPTSPMLSNLVTSIIDEQIYSLVRPLRIGYSRYADDLTFSGNFEVGMIVNKVRGILREFGFEVNNNKIRSQKRHQRQFVTGIVVNNKMQVSREKRRKLRQIMHYIEKFGYESHFKTIKVNRRNYIDHLIGTANHISFVNPKDSEVKRYLQILHGIKNQLSV